MEEFGPYGLFQAGIGGFIVTDELFRENIWNGLKSRFLLLKHLYCFDECPGIQVLQRLAPDVCPDDEGAASLWLSEFEYIRNGTIDVFAFLKVNCLF